MSSWFQKVSTQPIIQPSSPFSANYTSKSVAVFLAPTTSTDPKYEDLTRKVATIFFENKWKLVYDGLALELMDILARTASALGVDVHEVALRPLIIYEETGQLLEFGRQEIVEDIQSQKKRIVELSDAIIILPGGFGTLKDLISVRVWSQLGVCRRPTVLVNFQDYYSPLLIWLTKATELGFISESGASVVSVVQNVEDVGGFLSTSRLASYSDDCFTWLVIIPNKGTDSQSQFEKRLLDVAAIRHTLTKHYSTWHT